MSIEEMFGQITVEGCQRWLSELYNLDNKVTIGELKNFLTKRKTEAEKSNKEASEKLIREAKGKCFRIVYSADHTVILKIDDVIPFEKYGRINAELEGESIIRYKKDTRYEGTISNTWGNYFPCELEEFPVDEFNRLRDMLKSIKI